MILFHAETFGSNRADVQFSPDRPAHFGILPMRPTLSKGAWHAG